MRREESQLSLIIYHGYSFADIFPAAIFRFIQQYKNAVFFVGIFAVNTLRKMVKWYDSHPVNRL